MNGHHEKMQSFETLTTNEILSLFDSLNIVTKFSSAQDSESELATIECTEDWFLLFAGQKATNPSLMGYYSALFRACPTTLLNLLTGRMSNFK